MVVLDWSFHISALQADAGRREEPDLKSTLFDRSILSTFEEAIAFVGSILEASTEYSIIAKDLVGTIVLEPGFAASVRQSNVYTHLTRASTPPSASP